MKTLISRLGYGLILLIIIVSCSQPESEAPLIDTSMDVVEVDGEYMDGLMTAYKTFVENLSVEDRAKLDDYINSIPERNAVSGRVVGGDVECRCLTTQAHCSAKSATTECCVCWDPVTQVGICGKYMGVAFCRTEERPARGGEKAPLPEKSSVAVKIYPSEMKNLVDFIDRSNLGAGVDLSTTGLKDFKNLLSSL